MTTVREWAEIVPDLTSDGSAALYGPYWRLLVEQVGDRPLDDVRASDVLRVARLAQKRALRRRHGQSGVFAFEHLVAAARCMFALALKDGLVPGNPAREVEMPKRPPSRRHALTDDQVLDIFRVATDRDTIALRFLLETGARREGLCGLTRDKVRPDRQTVLLAEKGTRQREQPISRAMLAVALMDGSPLSGWTRRRLDGLWTRERRALPWADEVGVSSHWLRHTAITRMERVAGYAIAAAFAGHEAEGTTITYAKAGVTDVARAFSILYGEPHPLA